MQFTKGNTTVTLEKLWFLQRSHAARAATAEGHELEDMTRRVEAEVDNMLEKLCMAWNQTQNPTETSDLASNQNTELNTTLQKTPRQTSLSIDKPTYIKRLLQIDAKNYSTPTDFIQRNLYFFLEPTWSTPFANPSQSISSTNSLSNAAQKILSVTDSDWTTEALNARMKEIIASEAQRMLGISSPGEDDDLLKAQKKKDATAREKAYNKVFHDFLRWILLGGTEGPGSAAMMALLGRKVCVDRFEKALRFLDEVKKI